MFGLKREQITRSFQSYFLSPIRLPFSLGSNINPHKITITARLCPDQENKIPENRYYTIEMRQDEKSETLITIPDQRFTTLSMLNKEIDKGNDSATKENELTNNTLGS
jgi:hypothetical protein